MRHFVFVFSAFLVIGLSCTHLQDCDECILQNASKEMWPNGVPKKMKLRTFQDSLFYYLELDTLGRLISIETFWGDKEDGSQVNFYRGGRKIGAIKNMVQNEGEGCVYEFYPDLSIAFLGHLENDSFMGEVRHYYENGVLESVGDYFNSRKDGLWYYYYSSGQLKAKGTYVRGVSQDDWECRDEYGGKVDCQEVF